MNENGYYIPPEDEKPESENTATPAEARNFQTPPFAPVPEYDRKSVIARACSSGLFLAVCILTLIYTIVCAFPVMSFDIIGGEASFSSQMNVPIISLLVTIGLWIVYTSAGKGEFSASSVKLVSGSLKALRIVMWIVFVSLIVAGVLCIVAGVSAIAVGELSEDIVVISPADIEEISDMFREVLPSELAESVEGFLERLNEPVFLGILSIVFGAVFLFGSVGVIVYILFIGCLYKFARSLREWGEGEGNCVGIKAVRGAANWLIVMAVFACIGAMSFSMTAALLAAICIVSSVFIKKSFLDYAE